MGQGELSAQVIHSLVIITLTGLGLMIVQIASGRVLRVLRASPRVPEMSQMCRRQRYRWDTIPANRVRD